MILLGADGGGVRPEQNVAAGRWLFNILLNLALKGSARGGWDLAHSGQGFLVDLDGEL